MFDFFYSTFFTLLNASGIINTMHRVDFKKRKKLILRIFTYFVMTTLTLVTTLILVLAALGYRLGGDGEVIKSGLLLVNSKPASAQVYINGEDKKDRTDSRFVLPAGRYDIELKADGYRDWGHSVNLAASTVENFYYPFLIPEKLTPELVQALERPSLVSQSPDRKKVLLYVKSTGSLQLLELDPSSPKLTALTLPASFVRTGGSFGDLSVVEWADDDEHVLVKQSVNGAVRWLSIDTKKPSESVDISTFTSARIISKPRYARNNGAAVYAIRGSSVVQINLANGERTALLSRVKQYDTYSEDTLSFVRTSADGKKLEAGVWRDGSSSIIHMASISGSSKTGISTFTRFNDNDYLALRLANEKKVTIYRNPLKEPVLTAQLPYSTLALAGADDLSVGPNGQFILAQSGDKFAVYDLEHDRQDSFSAPKDTVTTDWMNSHHLQYKTKSGVNYISEFDGKNRYKLVGSSYGTALFSDDYESIYRVQKTDSRAQLQVMSLLIKN